MVIQQCVLTTETA